jgi:ABC-type uncharacterized transport system permease subunit
MSHFLRLYKTFIAQYFKRLLEYRIDFLTGAFSFLFDQVTSLVFILLYSVKSRRSAVIRLKPLFLSMDSH